MGDEIRADIAATTDAIASAQAELRSLVDELPGAPRAHKVEVSARLQIAIAKVRETRELLSSLEAKLLRSSIHRARRLVVQAERDLDEAVAQMQEAAGAQEAWQPEAVEAAFERLRSAKQTLDDLE